MYEAILWDIECFVSYVPFPLRLIPLPHPSPQSVKTPRGSGQKLSGRRHSSHKGKTVHYRALQCTMVQSSSEQCRAVHSSAE